MASEIHQNDIGTVDGASIHQINFKKPSDTVINRNATLQDYGISGVMHYDTIAGDLDEAGVYKLQAKVVVPSGTYYTDIYTFKVHSNI